MEEMWNSLTPGLKTLLKFYGVFVVICGVLAIWVHTL